MYQSRNNSLKLFPLYPTMVGLRIILSTHKALELFTLYWANCIFLTVIKKWLIFNSSIFWVSIVQVKCIDWQVCSEVNEHSYQYKRHSTSLVGCGRIHLWTLILPFLPVVTLHYVFWRQRGQGLSYYNPLGVLGLPYWGTFRFNSLSYL